MDPDFIILDEVIENLKDYLVSTPRIKIRDADFSTRVILDSQEEKDEESELVYLLNNQVSSTDESSINSYIEDKDLTTGYYSFQNGEGFEIFEVDDYDKDKLIFPQTISVMDREELYGLDSTLEMRLEDYEDQIR